MVTIGETMILLEAIDQKPLKYTPFLTKSVGGAESNVAIGLSRLGKSTRWIGRLGNDPFGGMITSILAGEGVDVSHTQRDDKHPTAVYFKDNFGAGDPDIYYYRKGSASSCWSPEHIRDKWFEGGRHLHMTGITPALGEHSFAFTKECMKRARAKGMTVSFDPNIRFKLWEEKKARSALLELIPLCDYFLPGQEEAEFLFGEGEAKYLAERAIQLGVEATVIKMGEKGSFGMLKNGQYVYANPVQTEKIVDTVGAGDAFAAGFLSYAIEGLTASRLKYAMERGNLLGSLIVQSKGDWEALPVIERIENKKVIVR